MSLLRDHISEFVSTFDPEADDAAVAFHEAVGAHFGGARQVPQSGPLRRAVVEVEVLWSEENYAGSPDWTNLTALDAEGLDGSASVSAKVTTSKAVSRSEMEGLLTAQGSDPEFLLGALCRFPGCVEDAEDGEGWDGWCGHHADTIEAHRERDHGHDPDVRTDCAVCAGHAPTPDDD